MQVANVPEEEDCFSKKDCTESKEYGGGGGWGVCTSRRSEKHQVLRWEAPACNFFFFFFKLKINNYLNLDYLAWRIAILYEEMRRQSGFICKKNICYVLEDIHLEGF